MIVTFDFIETSVGVFIGLVVFSFSSAIGSSIAKVYFEPALTNFKNRKKENKDGSVD